MGKKQDSDDNDGMTWGEIEEAAWERKRDECPARQECVVQFYNHLTEKFRPVAKVQCRITNEECSFKECFGRFWHDNE